MLSARILVVASSLIFVFLSASADRQGPKPSPAKIRTYYIAADVVNWDYAPRGRNLAGTPQPAVSEERSEQAGPKQKVYLKAIYREYVDATFKALKVRPPQWEHLGILGPLIRAEVGDTIQVVFRNNTKILCSMHPHGLSYAKDSEGASYNDGTSGADKKDDFVPPGGTYTYTWTVPARSGPGPGDASSILWMYHSHVVEQKDINTGLIGPIIVSAPGSIGLDGTPKDVDREFITAFLVFDETQSWYFESALMKFLKQFPTFDINNPAQRKLLFLYTINGLIEGNLPMMSMKRGEQVRWYLFAGTNEDDVHTAHWHGQTVVSRQMRTDTVSLEPMMMVIADMVPDRAGTWLFHCHVSEHIAGGMDALFRVLP